MGTRSKLYQSIQSRLLGAMALSYVAGNRGQADNPREDYPLPLPAALISLGPIAWKNMSGGLQEGKLEVEVRLYVERAGDDHDDSESEAAELEVMDKSDALWAALEGYSEEGYCGLNRRSERIERGKLQSCIVMTFATAVTARLAEREAAWRRINIK